MWGIKRRMLSAPPKPREQNDKEGYRDNGDDRVDAAKLRGGEDDERNENRDEENPRIVAWVNAVNNLGNDRNVAPLRVANQGHCETSNPGGPPVEDVGVAYDLDLGWCKCGVRGKGFPNVCVLMDCKSAADQVAADAVRAKQEDILRAADGVRKDRDVKITISGDFPTAPPYLKKTFKLDTVVEVRGEEITYRTPGLSPYKMTSGEKIEENFPGLCNGKQVSDQGSRVVMAAADKYLIHIDLQSRIDFHSGGCGGRYNYYKENFLIDLSDRGCKFTYRQDRDLFGVGAFENKIYDQSCAVEPLK